MYLRNVTLKKQLILLISVGITMMVFVQVFFNYRFYSVTQEKAEIYAMNTIDQVNINITAIQNNIREAAFTAAYNVSVQQYLLETVPSVRKIELTHAVVGLISGIANSNETLSEIAIIDNNENLTTAKTLLNTSIYRSIKGQVDILEIKKPMYITVNVQNPDGINKYLCYIVPIFNSNSQSPAGKKLGVCIVLCNINYLNKIIQTTSVTPGSIFLILDDKNQIITGNKPFIDREAVSALMEIPASGNLENKIYYNQELSLINIKENLTLGWKTVSIIPVDELCADLEPIRQSGILIGIVAVFLFTLIGILLSQSITRPISELIRTMAKIGDKNIKQRINISETNEIGTISKHINMMLDNVEALTGNIFRMQTKLYEAEISKKEAEVSALQSQINPHFLYNTLECMRSIGMINGINEIVDISSAMAKIFRYSIKGEHYSTIFHEIECVRDYLKIIYIRFDGKIKSEIDIEPGLEDCRIIKMIIQPIVENAVYHGLEKKEEEGTVHIHIRRDGENILIEIADDGIGLEEDEVARINKYLVENEWGARPAESSRNSIGLKNINNRIRLFYGDSYGITVSSKKDVGTTVMLRLPFIEKESEII